MGVLGFGASPRHAELVTRMFGEEEDVVPPGITLESDRPEYGFSRKERLWSKDSVVSAVAAAVGIISVENPAQAQQGPAMLSVLDTILVSTAGGAATIVAQLGVVGLQGVGPVQQGLQNAQARDMRWPGAVGPVPNAITQIRTWTATSLTAGLSLLSFVDNQTMDIEWPFVIPPGFAVIFVSQTANVGIRMSFRGYERIARPEELAV